MNRPKRRVVRRTYRGKTTPKWWVIDADGLTYPFGSWPVALFVATDDGDVSSFGVIPADMAEAEQ